MPEDAPDDRLSKAEERLHRQLTQAEKDAKRRGISRINDESLQNAMFTLCLQIGRNRGTAFCSPTHTTRS
jgi:hypothetical protein